MKISNILKKSNKILLRELIITDFKLRYQGSILGYTWSVLKPLFLFLILYIVFEKFLRIGKGIQHYPVYLLLGVILWGFFVESTNNGLQAIISRGSLIRKINFPKYIIVISGTVSSLINLTINLVVVMIFIVINGVHLHAEALWAFPLILELYAFSLAIAFFLSTLNVRFRDVGYLWDIFLQAAFYATPVIYPLGLVLAQSETAAKLLMMNPVAQVIQDMRYVLVTHKTIRLYDLVHGWKVLIPFIIILVVSILAVYYFKRNSKYFAEQI